MDYIAVMVSVLDKAREWSLSNLKDIDSVAVLLVGSWARGTGTDVNDIDIIIIKRNQLSAIYHEEHVLDGYTLDIWVHDLDNLNNELTKKADDLNQVGNISLVLSFLKDAVIWYQDESLIDIGKLQEKAKAWKWDNSYKDYLSFKTSMPTSDWAKIAYSENLELLDAALKRLDSGEPISHRRKDYPELFKDVSEEKAKDAVEKTVQAYNHLGLTREWTELKDATKAIDTGDWVNAIASIKDVLRFIIRYDLPSVPEQLMDPNLWSSGEQMTMSSELLEALKAAFL
ncbi:MAG: hypothetical protein OEY49_15635 [Candidatus Heimdallarchaeota archaeon]|nr:hypothetical protein [Candidatus Heimdallarchaeota archaeon]